MVFWKPLAKASVTIMIMTLITVALTDNLMTKREKDFCWLNAMRLAMKPGIFNRHKFRPQK
jgi:hypothetical protein